MCWTLGLCDGQNCARRLKSAILNQNTLPPSLYFTIKDHKAIVPGQPLPARPVCGATHANNGQLGFMIAKVLDAASDVLAKESRTESDSTQDMIATIEEKNEYTTEYNLCTKLSFLNGYVFEKKWIFYLTLSQDLHMIYDPRHAKRDLRTFRKSQIGVLQKRMYLINYRMFLIRFCTSLGCHKEECPCTFLSPPHTSYNK